MTKTAKIITLTLAGLAVTLTGYALLKRKRALATAGDSSKPSTKKPKSSGIIVGDSQSSTPNDQPLKAGVDDSQHVLQLQGAINDLHRISLWMYSNCSGQKYPVFAGFPVSGNGGDLLALTGTYDDKTAQAVKFYLNRSEVSLAYLSDLRSKLTAYHAGDKCKHPLGINQDVLSQLGSFVSGLFK